MDGEHGWRRVCFSVALGWIDLSLYLSTIYMDGPITILSYYDCALYLARAACSAAYALVRMVYPFFGTYMGPGASCEVCLLFEYSFAPRPHCNISVAIEVLIPAKELYNRFLDLFPRVCQQG
jgi:hypothetical protein